MAGELSPKSRSTVFPWNPAPSPTKTRARGLRLENAFTCVLLESERARNHGRDRHAPATRRRAQPHPGRHTPPQSACPNQLDTSRLVLPELGPTPASGLAGMVCKCQHLQTETGLCLAFGLGQCFLRLQLRQVHTAEFCMHERTIWVEFQCFLECRRGLVQATCIPCGSPQLQVRVCSEGVEFHSSAHQSQGFVPTAQRGSHIACVAECIGVPRIQRQCLLEGRIRS